MDEKQLLESSPGFRFNPTDEQLVFYYLKRKLLGKQISSLLIPEVDIYKFAPWDLPQMAGWKGDQSKWYFFCPRSKKYNRANRRSNDFGYWKTTGKDRTVRCNDDVVGKRRTLVFYRGRAPSGERTDWVMHEYMIEGKELDGCNAAQDWLVLCGIFKKRGPGWKTDMPWDETSWKKEGISNDDMCSQDFLTTAPAEGYSVSPTSAFPDNIFTSGQVEAMPSFSNITSETLDMDVSSSVNNARAVTGETLPKEFMGEDLYSVASWFPDGETLDLFSLENFLLGGPSECNGKKTSEYLDIWGPASFKSSDRWQKVRDNIKNLICLHSASDRWQKVRDNIKKLIFLHRGYRGPISYQKAKDSSLQELCSQAYSWDTTVCDPIFLGDSGIRISAGEEEKLVNCRRLKNSDSMTADDQYSLLDYSAGKLPAQYLSKLVNLLLLLTPSRSLTPNIRAECLAKVYLPGRHNVLLQDLVNLKHLDLSYSSFIKMPDLSRACKLKNLDLHGCNNLVDVSPVQYLTELEYINLKGCTSLMSLPSLMALKILCSLDVSDCNNLRRLPPSLGCLSSLATLDLRNCNRIQNLPKGILRLKSLQTLSVSGCSMLMEHASRVPTSTFVNPCLLPPSFSQSGPEGMLIEHQENPRIHSSLHTSAAEVSTSDQPVGKYASKITLQQPQEEIICNKYNTTRSEDDAAKPSSTAQDLERIPLHYPVTSPSLPSCDNSDTTFSFDLSTQHREVLKRYMSMPVEAIHQANAFYDVQRTVELLNQQSSDLHESASLHDLLYCLEELQENVPATMARMHDARVSKSSFQVTLAHLGPSFVRAEEQYSLLAAHFLVISDQEEELDAEIERLMAKRQELID